MEYLLKFLMLSFNNLTYTVKKKSGKQKQNYDFHLGIACMYFFFFQIKFTHCPRIGLGFLRSFGGRVVN